MIDSPPLPPRVSIPLWHRVPWAALWTDYRLVVVILAWGVCLGVAAVRIGAARTEFGDRDPDPDRRRADGNSGHAQIDFGGQWVMGRLAVTGRLHDLYDRQQQWRVVREAFPEANESPHNRRSVFPRHERHPGDYSASFRHDSEWMMEWFMGSDPPEWQTVAPLAVLPATANALSPNPFGAIAAVAVAKQELTPQQIEAVSKRSIGGPLYPPVHAFYYAPLGLLDPQPAYALFQYLTLGLTFAAGLGVTRLSRGRIWWPVATTVILLWPGYKPGIDLGQNHVLTLTILVWGWALAARGRAGWAGLVWGLLAFKPVWAVAFLLVPLVMRRWRFLAAMCGTGAGLVLATLPFTGVQPWLDWLAIGRDGSALYEVNRNWVFLSRDLSGIPRRFLIDFDVPEAERASRRADLASWSILLTVLAVTTGMYVWRGRRTSATALSAGFLLLGAYLCCYRFMYYDAILSVLPVLVLFADPGRFARLATRDGRTSLDLGYGWWPLALVVAVFALENYLNRMGFEATFAAGRITRVTTDVFGGTTLTTPKLHVATSNEYPWDTALLLVLWLWCAWRLIRDGDQGGEGR